jgi:hypothetical protein
MRGDPLDSLRTVGHRPALSAPYPDAPRRWLGAERSQFAARCAGIFAIAAATLMYEILLTRIFSVTMWYHFAFLAVASVLLGMTAGAILVETRPRIFNTEATARLLAMSALLFAIGVPATFVAHLAIPVVPTLTAMGLLSVLLTYAVITIPFVFSGITICLAAPPSAAWPPWEF